MRAAAVNILIFIECFLASTNAYHFTKFCSLLKNGTTLLSPVIYNEYVTCIDGREHSCNDKDTIYEPNKGKCTKNDKLIQLYTNPCLNAIENTKKTNKLMCNAYLLCKNNTSNLVFCEKNYHFVEEKQMCVPPEESQCVAGVNNVCLLAADDTLVANKEDCSKYYKCENGKPLKMDCGDLYFDVKSGKCVDHSLASCPCPNYMQPNEVVLISDGFSCRGYYRCEDRSGEATYRTWEMCPEGTYFHENSRDCLSPDLYDIKCTHDMLAGGKVY